MSLGWQCESALLPSNSKPIIVDGKSMVGLKAHLYDEQQKGKGNKDGLRNMSRSVTTARKDGISEKVRELVHKDRTANESKKGVSSEANKAAEVFAALTAKSKLYDEISQGKVQLQSELVNFEEKETPTVIVKEVQSYVPPPLPPTMPNPGKIARPNNNQQAGPELNLAQNSNAQVNTQPQWNWSRTYSPDDGNSGNFKDNNSKDYNSEYKNLITKEAELKKIIDERLRAEGGNIYGPGATETNSNVDGNIAHSSKNISEAARVKTQWEKTLNSSSRGYLDQVHTDTTALRMAMGHDIVGEDPVAQKRSLREEKLEQIRLKRSKLKLNSV